MDRNSNSPRLIQDLSSLLASVLPILQLFFNQLPPSVQGIFLASTQFPGVSIVTLVLSYVVIIAFQAKPWFEIILPFQAKRVREYQEYVRQINEVSAAANFVTGEQASASKMNQFLEKLSKNPKNEPRKIKRDNVISIGLVIIVTNATSFILISFLGYSAVAAAVQAINYVLLVVFSVLVLSVHRNTVQNNTRYAEENQTKTQRAIELATHFNVFGNLPQIRVVESFEDPGFPSNLHVIAQCNDKYYQITTDSGAYRLLRGRQLKDYEER